jgi:NADPH-dependent curcumin reductase CurA
VNVLKPYLQTTVWTLLDGGANVGGEHLEAALAAANPFAHFAICGMISQYNTGGMPVGPRNIMFVVGKSLQLEGFDIANYLDLMPEFQREMSTRIHEGKITWWETIDHGIENAPTALLKLFKGENFGKDAGEAGTRRSSVE